MSPESAAKISPNGKALLPLLLFLSLFLGTGTYLSMQGVEFAFYELKGPVAVLPAILLALLLSKDSINSTIDQFIAGVGDNNVIAMCIIYLLAGAFAAVASATGGVEATVNLGLSVIPSWFLLPGFFLISAFIATAMGT
ncbi:MAG: Na+/H+ antiporter NhaC family protein, partial [Psychrobium sp.]|nr:Na+/H+ antiporter NhaC family protein [Psychrobium sp.]